MSNLPLCPNDTGAARWESWPVLQRCLTWGIFNRSNNRTTSAFCQEVRQAELIMFVLARFLATAIALNSATAPPPSPTSTPTPTVEHSRFLSIDSRNEIPTSSDAPPENQKKMELKREAVKLVRRGKAALACACEYPGRLSDEPRL